MLAWFSTGPRCADAETPAASNHFDRGLPRVATEMALHVLAHNLLRELNIVGI
jgi:hypothetical protein